MKTEPPSSTADRRQRVQSAEVCLTILKTLARLGGAASLSAVAASAGESAAKVHRYLASLVQEGLVAQHAETQHYYLAREAMQIGLAAMRQCDPIRLGEASLMQLRETLEVTVFLGIIGNKGVTVMRMLEPALPVTVNIRAGSVLPILWSASGRAFLGFSSDRQIKQMAHDDLASARPEQRAALPSGEDPVEQLRQQIRAQGCATVVDTLLRGISAVSAPVLDASGQVCAVLTALGTQSAFDADVQGPIARAIRGEAAAISQRLGWIAPT